MQPAMLALVIHRGATFRARLRVMQPSFEYRPITSIAAVAPVQLTVDHGLPTDWPIWIDGVRQMPALNRQAPQQAPHFARVVDAGTLEINPISAVGLIPQGGQIQYHPPLPLVGATAELTLYTKGQATGTLPVTVDAGGWADVLLTDEQTAGLDWTAQEYTLDVTLGGDVIRAYTGTITTVAAGMSAPGTCQGFAVIGADRGPPGPTITAAEFDSEGRLVITLEDGTQLMTEPLNRPFESIIGDPMDNAALAALFNAKVDGEDYGAFVTAVNNALGERYTKDESDGRYDPAGAASDAVSAHEAAVDPHPQYTTAVEAAAAAPVQSVQGRAGAVVVTKADLVIENVDNTSDVNKPVSIAQQAAIDLRIPLTQKGADNGVATLDNEGKVPLSQISDAVLGQLSYQGLWDANTNTPSLPTTPDQQGDYYIASAAGTQFGIEFDVGDWLVSDGTAWGKVDNTDAVASVNGKKGVVTITKTDVGLGNADNTSDADKPVSAAQLTALNLKVDKVAGKQLSTEDYTTGEKTKLGALPTAEDLTTSLAGKQPLAANLTALAALTGAADRLPYFTGAGALSLATLTAFGRSLAGSADAAAGRSAFGLQGMAIQPENAVNITGGSAAFDSGSTPLSVSKPSGLGKIFEVRKASDPNSYFAIETGTSGSNLFPAFRAFSANAASQPSLFLIGDCLSTDNEGVGPLIRLSGRVNNGFVSSRNLVDIANVGLVRITVGPDGTLTGVAPFRPGTYTVATLPATAATGANAYATNGRKAGEGAGAGTGVPVHYQGGWKTYYDNTTVLA